MATTRETVEVVLKYVFEGQQDATKAKQAVKETGDEAEKTTSKLDLLRNGLFIAAGAFAAVAVAAKEFYQFLGEAGELQATANTFNNLAASIGMTSDAMLNELRPAASGMVSDIALMEANSRFLSMGLATTAEEAAKLTTIGSQLGLAFRGDAVGGMEEFALLLANQSIQRLDSFGISAGAVRERMAELKATVPGITTETAFMTAAMEQAEITLGRVGDQSATAAGQLAILEARAKTTADAFKVGFAEGFVPALEELNRLGDEIAGTDDSKGIGKIAAALGTIVSAEIVLGLRTIENIFENWKAFIDDPSVETFFAANFFNAFIDAFDSLGDLSTVTAVGMNTVTEKTKEVKAAVEETTTALQVSVPVWQGSTGAANDFHIAVATAHDELVETEQFLSGEFLDALGNADLATFDVEQAMLEQAAAAGASREDMILLAAATGDYTAEQIEAALKVAALTQFIGDQAQAVADGQITWEEALIAVQDFKATLEAIPPVTDATVNITVLGSAALQRAQSQIAALNQNLGLGSGGVQVRAVGDPGFAGGPVIVGEFGPELLTLPRGAQITSTNQTHNTMNMNVNGNSRRLAQLIHESIRRQSRPASVIG